jgi:hypothetical protein
MTIIINCIDTNGASNYPASTIKDQKNKEPSPQTHQPKNPVNTKAGTDGPLGIGDVLHAGGDVIGGALKTGSDILKGNIIGAVKDAGQGIYDTGKDIVKGVVSVGKSIGNFFSNLF